MTANHCTALADCPNPVRAKGLCNGHRLQLSKGQPFTPIQIRATARDDQGRKWCPKCSSWLHLDAFTNEQRRPDGKAPWCGDCKRMGEAIRRYNLTEERVAAMLADQGDACPICGQDFEGKRTWHVDHDHDCCDTMASCCGKCVRGLLCGACNRGLGQFRDSVERLRAAIRYLS